MILRREHQENTHTKCYTNAFPRLVVPDYKIVEANRLSVPRWARRVAVLMLVVLSVCGWCVCYPLETFGGVEKHESHFVITANDILVINPSVHPKMDVTGFHQVDLELGQADRCIDMVLTAQEVIGLGPIGA